MPKSDTYAQFLRQFHIERFHKSDDLRLFHEALALRIRVLVEQEGFPLDEEPDNHEEQAIHWVVREAETYAVVATARIVQLPFEKEDEKTGEMTAHTLTLIDKLAVLPEQRGSGTGRFLMVALLSHIRESLDSTHIAAIAHTKSITFFENLGFMSSKRYTPFTTVKEGALLMERI